MTGRHVAVVGGGPGGLYAARLIKLARPEWTVTVHERNIATHTFGFGVGLTDSTLRALDAADPVSARGIRDAGYAAAGFDMRVGSGARLSGGNSIAIGRAALIGVLREYAERAGAEVRTGHAEITDLDADLIIAADGVRSGVREKLAAEFGAQVWLDDVLYLWCGTGFALDCATFAPATTEHGTFVVHAYPYAADRSTFLIETDPQTWHRAGLQRADAATPDGESDQRSLRYLAEVFTGLLGGRELLGNATRWQRFATVHNARWCHGNVALLGDAAHTAHYSIGSGTKLALEDAIALAEALTETGELAAALSTYERRRRPRVERFQRIAKRSQDWWKTFPRRLSLAPARLLTSFMTRAGNVTVDQFAAHHPDVVADAAAAFGARGRNGDAPAEEDLSEAVLRTPLRVADAELPARLVQASEPVTWCAEHGVAAAALQANPDEAWGAAGERVLEQARARLADGRRLLWLSGSEDARSTVLSRLDLAERLRLDTGAPVGVDVPARYRPDAVGALLSGRADLVRLT